MSTKRTPRGRRPRTRQHPDFCLVPGGSDPPPPPLRPHASRFPARIAALLRCDGPSDAVEVAVINSMGRETMADNHGVATVDDDLDLDLPAHEATYVQFLFTVQLTIVVLLCILLLLVLWGLEGHSILALIGFIVTMVAATVGALTGLGWKGVAPIFVLLGLACVVL